MAPAFCMNICVPEQVLKLFSRNYHAGDPDSILAIAGCDHVCTTRAH